MTDALRIGPGAAELSVPRARDSSYFPSLLEGGGSVPSRPATLALQLGEKPRGFQVLPRRWMVERTHT